MGGQIGMDFVAMQRIITDLQQYTRQIRDWVTTLEANSEKSLATWDGDAKAQYYQEREIWRAAITEMEQGLARHGTALYNINDTTYRGEMRNRERWVDAGKPV
jgi:WXG100 family type VII secretion target